MTTGADDSQTRPQAWAAAAIRDHHVADFAFVMATGIISTGFFVIGPPWLSQALLVIASIGFLVLLVALVLQFARYRSRVAAQFEDPDQVFGFFAIAAGTDVLAARFASAGQPQVAGALACLGAVVWVVLTYTVPASLLLACKDGSVLSGVDGTWLLWVVGSESLSIASATLLPAWPSQSRILATAAIALWGIGLVLYLLLVSLIMLRWLTIALTPATLSPPYWILMGATAIITLAGADILNLPANLPAVHAITHFVEGICFVFWAFGTWWIPLLIVLGFWRHVLRQWPLRYEAALWAVVFPIGMYSVATLSFGKAARLSFMEPLDRGGLWAAVVAWLLVALAGLAKLARNQTDSGHRGDAPTDLMS